MDERMKEMLESVIDMCGVKETLEAMGDICHEKATHIRVSYGDQALSDVWDITGTWIKGMASQAGDKLP